MTTGLGRAGGVARHAAEQALVGGHAVGDRQPTAPGRRVVRDGEVGRGGAVDGAVVVVPGDARRRLTDDDAAERHLGAVASRHARQRSREGRRCRRCIQTQRLYLQCRITVAELMNKSDHDLGSDLQNILRFIVRLS